ncbi:NAD(P)/FAD-dependent oxidoreductase [Synoicihabitans lomoniglobus]|uniref:FAD-dependent oxidoreductase n=1 Tax=Synoicihabitans lomoniglobus TaxID=2909285 RepID=A0AAF0CN44_9BACT|nr:FAD-binding oxidoreductase [Opitutaceae bacterium LMO-M01]WED65013.1 FAD-dependent oxidoreductase [Opitutaceae bacterium LMO-M01]
MNTPIQIVGQGVAGSWLAWECERAGVGFQIIDRGHAEAASRVGAGLVSPLTGRRLAPTWRFTEWRDSVLAAYREIEQELGCPLVRELRLRRQFRDDRERVRFKERVAASDAAPWVESIDDNGLWLRGAFQVETGRLIAALRERWIAQGKLDVSEVEPARVPTSEGRTVWCIGARAVGAIDIGCDWEPSKGELVRGRMDGLEPDVVLNDGQWLLPLPDGHVRVGATFERHDLKLEATEAAQQTLREAAERLGGQPLREPEAAVGLRVTVKDRRPVVGWLDAERRVGVFGGLAAKGALWAPALARQWLADGLSGGQIEAEARADRF